MSSTPTSGGSISSFTEEYAFECTACASKHIVAFESPIESDVVFSDCDDCGAEDVEMEKVSLREVLERRRFKLHLQKFIDEEVESLGDSAINEVLEEVAEGF